jgi:hypothetical protein
MAATVADDSMADAIRLLPIDTVEKADGRHPRLPMGAADIATVLSRDVLKFDAANLNRLDRDRFALSRRACRRSAALPPRRLIAISRTGPQGHLSRADNCWWTLAWGSDKTPARTAPPTRRGQRSFDG